MDNRQANSNPTMLHRVPKISGMSKNTDPGDIEDVLDIIQIDENTWEGKYPLRLPVSGARGVYGGHLIAQSLLVFIDSAPGFLPHSFHSHFLRPGNAKVKCLYQVTRLNDGRNYAMRLLKVLQNGKIVFTALCSLVKKGAEVTSKDMNLLVPPPPLHAKYPDPNQLDQLIHTEFCQNAFSEEFLDYKKCPEEASKSPSERWITIWSKLHQPGKEAMKDPKFNYVALAELSDSAILTTLARALHLNWNPTLDNPLQEYDDSKDARRIIDLSLNALHIFHYEAMSLDHHLYFHTDDFESFNPVKDWLTLAYQYKISRNHRSLVRGFFYNPEGNCVATFVQEGLTYLHPGVPDQAHGRNSSNL